MADLLFVTWDGGGNVPPATAIARELARRGHTVRFVGNPLKFFKYFVNNKSAICANPDTCSVRSKYNIEPNVRYVVNVLDRDEKNRVRAAAAIPGAGSGKDHGVCSACRCGRAGRRR